MDVRFAAIPKCASRSLAQLGLLGERVGGYHSRITEYPQWDRYEWWRVDRDSASWYRSWWICCEQAQDQFTRVLGFEFKDMEKDLELLNHPGRLPENLPRRAGPNAWLPGNVREAYADALALGKDWKAFCIETICSGVPHQVVDIKDLDGWLRARGYVVPAHQNVTRSRHSMPYPDGTL